MSLAPRHGDSRLGAFSWALFEWARNPYVILIVIYVFAPYFSRTLVGDPVRAQGLLGLAAAVTGGVIAIGAPLSGAVADTHGRRKPWLAGLVVVMAPALGLLWFAAPGPHGLPLLVVLVLMGIASLCYEFSQVFHNAMLPSVAPARAIGSLSGLGLALGNAAGLLLMGGVLALTTVMGVDNTLAGRLVGPVAALWLVVFTLPLILFTPDEKASGISLQRAMVVGARNLLSTLRRLGDHRQAALYLLARMFFNDGAVGILTFGGVYASGTFGWGPATMLSFGIITSFTAVLGGLVGGWLDDRLGSKRTLMLALTICILGWIVALSFSPDHVFYVIAVTPGRPIWSGPLFQTLPEVLYFLNNQVFAVVLTITFSSARSLLARLAPPGMVTQMFGLYALSGSATGFIAPLLVGAVTLAFHSQKAGVGSLLILLGLGLALLTQVRSDDRKGGRP